MESLKKSLYHKLVAHHILPIEGVSGACGLILGVHQTHSIFEGSELTPFHYISIQSIEAKNFGKWNGLVIRVAQNGPKSLMLRSQSEALLK